MRVSPNAPRKRWSTQQNGPSGTLRGAALALLLMFVATPTRADTALNPPISYLFSTNGDTQGWSWVNLEAQSVSGGLWTINPGPSDPRLNGPLISMPPSAFNYLKIGIKNKGANTSGRIYFEGGASFPPAEVRSVGFNVPNDLNFHWLTVHLGGIPSWTSPSVIDRIRIDPVQAGVPMGGTDDVQIDYIFIRSDKHPPPPPSIQSVTPSGWTNVNSFSITWTNLDPADEPNSGPDVYGSGTSHFRYWTVPGQETQSALTAREAPTGIAGGAASGVAAGSQGASLFHVYAFDRVGRVGSEATATLHYDGTPPTAAQSGGPPPAIYNSDQTIGFTVADQPGLSGISGYCVSWDNPTRPASPCVSAAGGSVTLLGAGATNVGHTLYVHAYDNAGNAATFNLGTWTLMRPPSISVASSVVGVEGTELVVPLTAADPDGDAINSLTADDLPPGATFTVGPGNTSGTLTWTPTFVQAGVYTPSFTAANALSTTAGVTITINNTDRAPLVTAPISVTGQADAVIQIAVTASDPDGDLIASLLPDLSNLPPGNNATFSSSPGGTSGSFTWVPTAEDTGSYVVSFTASNAATGGASTTISVEPAPPVARVSLVSPAANESFDASPTFVWSSLDGAGLYRLLVTTTPTQTSPVWVKTIAVPDTSTTYSGDPLPVGTYYWSIQALVDASWTQAPAPRRFFRGPGVTVLIPPTLQAPIDLSVIGTPEYFSWDEVPGSVAYRCRVSADAGFSAPLWTAMTSTERIVLPSSIPGMLVGVPYFWNVQALDAFGNLGPTSATRQFTVSASALPPSDVVLTTPPSGSTVASQIVTFAWEPAARATQYDLVYSTSPGFPEDSDATWTLPGLTRTGASISLPATSTPVYWKVVPRNSVGAGPTSPVMAFQFAYPGTEIRAVSLQRPGVPLKLGVGTEFTARAQVYGERTGSIQGVWRLNGADWQPFVAEMTAPGGVTVESPPLPTTSPGSNTIQCLVTDPVVIASAVGAFDVVPTSPGPAARITAFTSPLSLPADGVSLALSTITIEDSVGLMVTVDNGREITATVSGPAVLQSSVELTASGSASFTVQAGVDDGEVELRFTAAGLIGAEPANQGELGAGAAGATQSAASTRIVVASSALERARSDARFYLARLDRLPTLPWFFLASAPPHPGYSVSSLDQRISTTSSVAALERLTLVERALLSFYHHDRFFCTPGCDSRFESSGALLLADEAMQSASSVIVGCMGAAKLAVQLRRFGPGWAKRLPIWGQIERFLANFGLQSVEWASFAIKDEYVKRGVLDGVNAVRIAVNKRTGLGESVAELILDSGLRSPAVNSLMEYHFVARQTQDDLDLAVARAAGPFGGTTPSARSNVETQMNLARWSALSAAKQAERYRDNADGLILAADWTQIGSVVMPASPWGMALSIMSTFMRLAGIAGYSDSFLTALRAYSSLPDYASRSVAAAFPAAGTVEGEFTTPPTEGPLALTPSSSTRALWAQALSTQVESTEDYESVARQLQTALQADDTTGCSELLGTLLQAAATLDAATELAASPLMAAALAASERSEEFESKSAEAERRATEATLSRIQYAIGVAQLLDEPSSEVARQAAIDFGSSALDAGAAATAALEESVPMVFAMPALPLLRVTHSSAPESTSIGVAFPVVVHFTNMGSGAATGAFARVHPDSAFVCLSPDSMALQTLLPGESAIVTWNLVPTTAGTSAADTAWTAGIQVSSGCETGRGAATILPMMVHRPAVTDVDDAPTNIRRLHLRVGPNPGHGSVNLSYGMPSEGIAKLQIFDVHGRLAATLLDGQVAGTGQTIEWNGTGLNGSRLRGGVYFARLSTAGGTVVQRFVYLSK